MAKMSMVEIHLPKSDLVRKSSTDEIRFARHSGRTAEPDTWLRSVSIGVSVTMIQSVREKELHLLQQPPHPVTVVRDLKRLLPSRSRFSTSPSRVRGF